MQQAQAHSAATEDARFDKVLAAIQTEIDLIAAQRLRVLQTQQKRERLIARAHAQEQARLAKQAFGKFQLMELPYELRRRVLYYAIEPIRIPLFLKKRLGKPPIPLPPVARIRNKRLRQESLIEVIEQTAIVIHSKQANEGVQRWLGKIDVTQLAGDTSYQTGFDAVKVLCLPYFSCTPSHSWVAHDPPRLDIVLLNKCKNLSSVEIHFRNDALVNEVDGSPKNTSVLNQEFGIEGLFTLSNLRTLYVSGIDPDLDMVDRASYAGAIGLMQFLQAGFEARNMKVDVSPEVYRYSERYPPQQDPDGETW